MLAFFPRQFNAYVVYTASNVAILINEEFLAYLMMFSKKQDVKMGPWPIFVYCFLPPKKSAVTITGLNAHI
jgi:hypothetical protein